MKALNVLRGAFKFVTQKDTLIAVLFASQAAMMLQPTPAPRVYIIIDLAWAVVFLLLATLRTFDAIPPPDAAPKGDE